MTDINTPLILGLFYHGAAVNVKQKLLFFLGAEIRLFYADRYAG